VAKYIVNIRIVFLLILAIFMIGVIGYASLPKRLNPEIKIPIVTVVTALPGASPSDIESLITIPIENAIKSVKGIDVMTSVSRENVSIISIQFVSTVLPEKAKTDVQTEVDGITDLPADAKTPSVNAVDFENQPVWTFAVYTSKDVRSLMSFSNELKKRLEDVATVDKVELSGYEDQEVSILVLPEKIREFGFNPLALSQSIQKGLQAYPAGNIDTGRNSFALTIDPQIAGVADIRNIRISVQGKVIRLGDIATVMERSKSNQKHSYLAGKTRLPERVITFYAYKTTGVNIDKAAGDMEKVVEETLAEYRHEYTVTNIENTAEAIEDQFSDLLGEFRSTILLIIGCLFIFLGLRQAIISSFSVPLTFLSAFFFMNMFGQSINFLTLFAFLLALGLLIDDTIVVVSAMTTYYKTGKFTPAETGLLVWRDTIIPIWSTTVTTIWSFVPLLLTTGIIGEFIKPIPTVVTVTMMSSTAIAVLITLPLMIILLKPKIAHRVTVLLRILGFASLLIVVATLVKASPLMPLVVLMYIAVAFVFMRVRTPLAEAFDRTIKKSRIISGALRYANRFSNHGIVNIEPLANAYYRLIMRILNSDSARRKVIFAIITYSVVAFLLVPLGLVKNEFFPKSDSELVYVNLNLPSGTTARETARETSAILEKLRHIRDTNIVVAETSQQMSSGMGSRSDNTASSVFTVHLPKQEERSRQSMDIATEIRSMFKGYTKGDISVIEQSSGPPAGSDLQIKLSGTDLNKLDSYAEQLMGYLRKQSGIANVDKSIKPGTGKITFNPDPNRLAENGMSADAVGLWLRMYASGFPLGTINLDKSTSDKTDITLHLTEEATPQGMGALQVPTNTGASLPVSALGEFTVESNPTSITREDGKRTISVTASVLPGYNITEKNQNLEKFADSMNLEEGYGWATGGVNEENQKSVMSILQAMGIAFILILVTMVLQFQSYRQALIVLMVIPLAVSSVFVVFGLTGTPLSFPALIGVLSLFGIVVTNSMFIVDKININQKEGMPFKEAIADAGASRLEPIILTKLNTILGLVPITLSNPLWRGLGGAIISGVALASFIMLLFIPAVYYSWFHDGREH